MEEKKSTMIRPAVQARSNIDIDNRQSPSYTASPSLCHRECPVVLRNYERRQLGTSQLVRSIHTFRLGWLVTFPVTRLLLDLGADKLLRRWSWSAILVTEGLYSCWEAEVTLLFSGYVCSESHASEQVRRGGGTFDDDHAWLAEQEVLVRTSITNRTIDVWLSRVTFVFRSCRTRRQHSEQRTRRQHPEERTMLMFLLCYLMKRKIY